MSIGCSSCDGGGMRGMGFLEGLGDTTVGPQLIQLTPDEQAAYAANTMTPDQLANIKSFFYDQGAASVSTSDPISSLFSGNGMIWIVVGIAVFAMMSGSGGRRR